MKKTFLLMLSLWLSTFILSAHVLNNNNNRDTDKNKIPITLLDTEEYEDPIFTTEGGTITTIDGTTALTICAGDGISDAFDVNLTGAEGTNSAWVITDANGNILALPPGPPFDLEGAGGGACLVWHLSFEDGLMGAEVGLNANDLEGDFDLSNPITVNRITTTGLDGGTLEGGPFEFCAGDGIEDNVSGITLSGNIGTNSAWVVTDDQGNILGLPPMPGVVDFDGAGGGTCLIWHLSFEDGLVGAEVGLNANDLQGCFDLSNPISVIRNGVNGGELETAGGMTELTICAGDGISDAFDVNLSGNEGTNSAWVITDSNGNILGLPPGPPFDLEGAGGGACLVWHLSFEDGLTGAEVGLNAGDLEGCFDLSNPITVNRITTTGLDGGTLEGGPFEFCAGDGIEDNVSGITLSGNIGTNSAWVVTDDQGNILGLPSMPGVVDFDGAGGGTCLIWHLSFEDGLVGAEVGLNANDLQGCFDLSNPITVNRNGVNGGELETVGGMTELTICAGDGISDAFDVNLSGNEGTNSAWVITDSNGNILGLPPGPPFDLEGAGGGACLVWHLSFEDGLTGAEVGLNAGDLEGCFDLSNPITVNRNGVNGGELETAGGMTELTICAGDGISDAFDVNLSGNEGTNSAWVITDANGNILGLPPGPPFDLEGAGGGACLVWHLSFEDGLIGAEVGLNAGDLEGCFDLSNPITVIRLTGNDCPTGDGVDLELSIAVDNVLYDQYENVTYTITVMNNSSENATNVVIEAGLPNGMVYTDHDESAGDYNLFFEEWTLDELAAGESATLELVLFTLVEDPDIINFVQVVAQDQPDVDSAPGNGNGVSPQEDDEAAITITPIDPNPQGGTDSDLSLTISASTDTYDQYENVTYTITLTNNGPDDATGIVVSAGLPDGMVYTDDFVTDGDYNLFFEEWRLDFLESGESAVLELVLFTLIEDDDITNFVEVIASDQDDPDSTPDNGNGVSPQEDDEAAVTVSFLESFAGGSIPSFDNNQQAMNMEGIDLFPVPAKDQLTVNLSLSQDEVIDIQVFDITGRMMSFEQLPVVKGFDKFELDVSNLADGLYFLNIRYADTKVLNEKFQKVSK